MMKHEFEKLAGYEVSYEDYEQIIEPMYMATEMSKQDFVKCIDKKRFALKSKAQIKREMRKIADHLHEICGHYRDFGAEEALEKLAREYAERFAGYHRECLKDYYYFEKGYEYEEAKRGCTYPKTLIIGREVKGFCQRTDEVILYV